MFLRTETLRPKKLVGMKMRMSLTNNVTPALWKNFMQRRKEVQSVAGQDLYSMQLLDTDYFNPFDASKEFEKWAAIEVNDFENVPQGMERFDLKEGLYAVFLHKGDPSTGAKTFMYIMGTWLPASEYALDNRPHFEILGEKYKNGSLDSEEEIWIPIKTKQ